MMRRSLVNFLLCAGLAAQSGAQSAVADGPMAGLEALSRDLEAMIAKVSPSVVKIYVSGSVPQAGIVPSTGDLGQRSSKGGKS